MLRSVRGAEPGECIHAHLKGYLKEISQCDDKDFKDKIVKMGGRLRTNEDVCCTQEKCFLRVWEVDLVFCSGLQLTRWGPHTLWRAICFSQNSLFNPNLIYKHPPEVSRVVYDHLCGPCGRHPMCVLLQSLLGAVYPMMLKWLKTLLYEECLRRQEVARNSAIWFTVGHPCPCSISCWVESLLLTYNRIVLLCRFLSFVLKLH